MGGLLRLALYVGLAGFAQEIVAWVASRFVRLHHPVTADDIIQRFKIMRRFARFVAVCLVVILVGAYLLLFPPFPRVPEFGRGLPSQTATAAFQERLRVAFPLPMTRNEIASGLIAQGFDVSKDVATFEKTRFPCTLIWRIWWETEGEAVTDISAMHGSRCL
ncbi:hypothetical protein [Yoonia sp. 2307UL14-13]|uniref:hypothetical protein n=1 Tax=Yoonia sp. 2307UL14-13 TaxID=3126506 RepID=UPI0030ABD625